MWQDRETIISTTNGFFKWLFHIIIQQSIFLILLEALFTQQPRRVQNTLFLNQPVQQVLGTDKRLEHFFKAQHLLHQSAEKAGHIQRHIMNLAVLLMELVIAVE